ncbi:Portal protein [Dissostichus eleginoides]|uniref:Portal protein n=1 Tax=Dissostichus eleginoides TaxID=100907 RepID=A0AAD9B4P7_DISEL|nr:Portal protein [Dissostichus eleginoides]
MSAMESDLGADLGPGPEACGAPDPKSEDAEGEGSINLKGGDGEFSSASSSSNSSLPSSSSTLPSFFTSPPPICVEEEQEMLTGCSKSFTGLKIFTRR